MTETGTVIKIDGDIVTLTCGDNSGCTSCAAHGICGGVEKREFEAWNPEKLELQPGSKVEVLLPTGKTIGSAFMVMIFPLLLFFIFFYASNLFIDNPGEGIKVLFGLAGIAISFGINFILNRKPRKRSMPQITKILK